LGSGARMKRGGREGEVSNLRGANFKNSTIFRKINILGQSWYRLIEQKFSYKKSV